MNELTIPERLAVVEANRENDVRRIAAVERAVDQIKYAALVILGAVVVQVILTGLAGNRTPTS